MITVSRFAVFHIPKYQNNIQLLLCIMCSLICFNLQSHKNIFLKHAGNKSFNGGQHALLGNFASPPPSVAVLTQAFGRWPIQSGHVMADVLAANHGVHLRCCSTNQCSVRPAELFACRDLIRWVIRVGGHWWKNSTENEESKNVWLTILYRLF